MLSFFQALGDRSLCTNYNWCLCHPHVKGIVSGQELMQVLLTINSKVKKEKKIIGIDLQWKCIQIKKKCIVNGQEAM